MGDSYLIFYPADRFHLPSPERIAQTITLLGTFGENLGIAAYAHERPTRIYPHENFDGVYCPDCGPDLEAEEVEQDVYDWWFEAVDRFEEDGTFTVTTPCYGREFALDELDYDYAPGFARCSIEVFYLDWPCMVRSGSGLWQAPDDVLASISDALGCDVRYLWQHI